MRQLAEFESESQARRLSEALTGSKMPASVTRTRSGRFALWVHDDAHLDDARAFIDSFRANPDHPRYAELAKRASEDAKRAAREDKRLQRRTERIRSRMQRQTGRIGSVTLALIVLCTGIFILMQIHPSIIYMLTFAGFKPVGNGQLIYTGLEPILHGQIWRLVTPALMHGGMGHSGQALVFGLVHLGFNMWWLKDLGTIIEHLHHSWYFLVMVLVIAVVSHVLQFVMAPTSLFLGMSGVVYGLFAFLWVRGRFDPAYPFRFRPEIVVLMLAWLAIDFFGTMHIANWVHLGGLVTGAVWGLATSGWFGRKLRAL